MNRVWVSWLAALVAAMLCALAPCAPAAIAPRLQSVHAAPLAFEINLGQTDARARYLARGNGIDLYLTEAGALLTMTQPLPAATAPVRAPWQVDYGVRADPDPRAAATPATTRRASTLRYGFAGANAHPRVEGLDPLPGYANYFLGNDPRQWRTQVPTYRRVRYHEVYPGVDVVYYGDDGKLEFDVEVAPGADLAQVRLRVDGADALALDASGDLRVRTALGELTQHRPVVYQVLGAQRRELRGSYALHERDVAFDVAGYDRRVALVLDPTLVWTSQVGGSAADANYGVAVDASGNWYFAGFSDHSATVNFPTTLGAYQTGNNGGSDAFVRKLSNDGTTVLYSTLLGGSGNDNANGIGVDAAGNAYVVGTTYSGNFPTQSALQSAYPAGSNGAAFVASLNSSGSGLNYSTYLAGSAGFFLSTSGNGIAVDAAGNAYVTGETTTDNLPTSASAFQPQPAMSGNTSAFVFKLAANGSRVFGTYLVDDYFGLGGDHGAKIAIDDAGNAFVVGFTNSFFGGTYNGVSAAQIGPGGGTDDMLVARLNHTGQWLDWVTHIGGSAIDKGTAIAVDGGQQVMVAGWSASSDLPPAFTNNDDWGWIGQLDQTGTQLLDSTFIGAAGAATFPEAIAWDELIVAGSAQKPSALPATNPVAGLDCGAQCGGNSSYGGFLALLTTGPLTLQSLTRVLGATGSDTRFHGVTQDAASAVGRSAVAVGTNGIFPGTMPAETSQAAAAAAVDTRAAAARPPVVSKRIEPGKVEPGQQVTVSIAVFNPKPNPISIVDLNLDDNLPPCLVFEALDPSGSLTIGRASSGRIFVTERLVDYLSPGELGVAKFRAKAGFLLGPCTNTTGAATSNAGTSAPASATVMIKQNDCDAISTGTCTSMNLSDAACWNGGVAPTNTCDAEIAPCTGGTCTINADQPVDQKIGMLTLDGDTTINGGPLFLGTGLRVISGNSIATLAFVVGASGKLELRIQGFLYIEGGVGLDDTDLGLTGTGQVDFQSAITGSGHVSVSSGEADFDVSPTFTGSIDIAGGTLLAKAAIPQSIFLDGSGTLRGGGPFGAIEESGGDFHPCTSTTTPCTVDVSTLDCEGGKVELDCAANNTPCTAIHASGAVVSQCDDVVIHLSAQPPVGTVFSDVVTGATNTCTPENVHATPANVFVAAQCSGTGLSLVVQAVDGVFRSGF